MATPPRGHGPKDNRPAAEPTPARRLSAGARATLAADARARYEAGETVRVIAASLDHSYGFAYNLLVAAGVEFRPRGGSHRKRA